MAKLKLAPDEVFTPRSAVVNDQMYIARTRHEAAILHNLSSDKNMIIHGESGCGKSWLYKKVFKDYKIQYITVNMANADRFGGIDQAFDHKFRSIKKRVKVGSDRGGDAEVNLFMYKGGISEVERVEELFKEPFERLLEICSDPSGKQSYIVLENMESILHSQKIVDQVSNIVTLVDDEDYASYNVRLLIVGVPNDIQSYFSKARYYQTISNRVVEIPEVERLSFEQATDLLHKGLIELLGYDLDDLECAEFVKYTDCIPQYLHEFGKCLAYSSMTQKKIDRYKLRSALWAWMDTSFTSDLTAVKSKMNSNRTSVGRRNQVIYCIGRHLGDDFTYTDVEALVRREFPSNTRGRTLNVNQILAELASEPHPLIRKNPTGKSYRFVSPKIKICIRCTLTKDEGERVDTIERLLARNAMERGEGH